MNHKILSDSAESHHAYLKIQALTKQYNKLGNGKWQHIMDAAPRRLPVFEDVRASLAKDTLQGRSMYHCHAQNNPDARPLYASGSTALRSFSKLHIRH